MEITFASSALEKVFNAEMRLRRVYGPRCAQLIMRRLASLRAARALSDFAPPYRKPERCHELTGDRRGQLSMDLDHPRRLLFTVANEPPPERTEGGLDWSKVTAVEIRGVEDTHE